MKVMQMEIEIVKNEILEEILRKFNEEYREAYGEDIEPDAIEIEILETNKDSMRTFIGYESPSEEDHYHGMEIEATVRIQLLKRFPQR